MTRRTERTVDRLPLGEQEAEWLSGATAKPMARPEISDAVAESLKVHSVDSKTSSRKAAPPPLFRVLAELEVTRRAPEDATRFRDLTRRVVSANYEKKLVGGDGIEAPTPGFPVLEMGVVKILEILALRSRVDSGITSRSDLGSIMNALLAGTI